MSSCGDERLEAQAQQRLGVRRAHVEVPVVVVDRDAVELRLSSRVGVALLDLGHLGLRVGDLGVDLAGDEVLSSGSGASSSDSFCALLREQLEDQQRRDRAGVGVVEVGEVVVAGDLAAEDAALVAHARLEERVADAVDVRACRRPPRRCRRPRARRGRRRGSSAPGLLRQQRLGEQRGEEVAVDERARVVDEEAAVGVAVPGDAEVGALVAHLVDDELRGSPAAAGWARGRGTRRRASSRCRRGRGPRRSSSGPTIGPAMPLPPSTTTFSGLTRDGSMNRSAASWNSAVDVDLLARCPPPGASGRPAAISRADVLDARVARQRDRARARTSFAPV